MSDHFTLLDEPRRPWLDVESLKSKFLTLSAEVHPDRFHNASETEKSSANQRYAALNSAYNCLRDPRQRIRHLLELELAAKPSDLTNVPDDLMEIFFAVGKSFRAVDALLAEKASASSPLIQAQLFVQGMDRAEELNAVAKTIATRRDALLEQLRSLDSTWRSGDAGQREQLLDIWRLLGFYDRWLAQIQERVNRLTFS